MRISGRVLILIGIAITIISTLFCIIGLATKGWDSRGGIFCDGCYKAPAALSIISFILLLVTIAALVLQMLEVLTGILQLVPTILLLICTIFLLGTFVSFVERGLGYSFDLMVAAHFCSYVALAIVAFGLGQLSAGSGS